jgi:hypothetical protein
MLGKPFKHNDGGSAKWRSAAAIMVNEALTLRSPFSAMLSALAKSARSNDRIRHGIAYSRE